MTALLKKIPKHGLLIGILLIAGLCSCSDDMNTKDLAELKDNERRYKASL